LVRVQTGLKNKIHSLLAKKGINTGLTDLFGKKGLEYLSRLSLQKPYQGCLEGYLRVLKALKGEIRQVDKELKTMAQKEARAELLTSIPGVGDYSALLILAEVGDISRFPDARHLASYAGLVPGTYSSGNRALHGSITRQGSRWQRWIVVEASTHVVNLPGNLRDFYQRLRGAKGSQVARVAVARKLLGIIYHMLKHNKDYHAVMRASSLLPMAQVNGRRHD
jgi:transposase